MNELELKFSDCRSCIRFKLNKSRTEQVETEACRECDSGEFYEEKCSDTVKVMSRVLNRKR